MAVIRTIKNDNYTTMSNYHLKDKELSLKAKGLLSMMLSFPDEWHYSVKGLKGICKESVNTINGILNELEEKNYLVRRRKYLNGKISEWEYVIFETNKNHDTELLHLKNEDIENEDIENVDIENVDIENEDVYKYTKGLNTKVLNTNRLNTKGYIVQNDLENHFEPSVIQLTLNDKTLYDVSENDFKEYEELYPNVDIMQELRKMKGWLNANPTKRKTKRGIKRFINSWLSREQDKPKPNNIYNNVNISNNIKEKPTPKWVEKQKEKEKKQKEIGYTTKELLEMYDKQIESGSTDLAEHTSNLFKELNGWSIKEYRKSVEELNQIMEQNGF
jgi:hypothetical protein